LLALFCAVISERELQDKWMQQAIRLETNADRRRLLQCESLIWDGDYAAALAEAKQLPTDLQAYGPSAGQLVVGCLERLGDWTSVKEIVQHQKDTLRDSLAVEFNLVLALYESGDAAHALEKIPELQASVRSRLAINVKDGDAGYYLAFCYRLLGQKEQAYALLRQVLPENISSFPYALTLKRADPSLDVFAKDPEYQAMIAGFEKKNEETRRYIRELEKTSG
jgi:tetratricopeptide (TPR) repeat protein